MSQWIIDPDHSVGAFSIRHMMVAYVHGQFNKVSGTVQFDPADLTSFSLEFEIDVSSIITGIQKRDDHLKSEDFFHEKKYPKITFRSTNSERTGFNNCKVSGEITIHGVIQSIVIDATISGPVNSPFGETTIGITGAAALNREDFGLTWNEPMEKNGMMVGKEVAITMDIEADLTEEL